MKNKYRLRELGSLRLILLLGMHIAVTIGFAFIGFAISNYQISSGIIREGTWNDVIRNVMLCLFFALLMLGVADYFILLQPIEEMESLLESYLDLANEADNRPVLDSADRITLRRAFAQLIYQEKLNVRKSKALEQEQLSSELHALQARINPHFLYNTLDCIRGMALYHDMEDIADMTESFSRLFRSMVLPEGKLLTLRQETQNIADYVRIQMFRFNHNFEYFCEIDDEILDRYRIPNMTLQPLVENAIMHGLEQKIGMGYVRINAEITERRLIVTVADNGVGIPDEKIRELNESFNMGLKFYTAGSTGRGSGIGLATINRRIKLQFGDKYGLHLSGTQGVQTIAEVILPLVADNR